MSRASISIALIDTTRRSILASASTNYRPKKTRFDPLGQVELRVRSISARAVNPSEVVPGTPGKVSGSPGRVLYTLGRVFDTLRRVLETPGRVLETPGRVLDTPTAALKAENAI